MKQMYIQAVWVLLFSAGWNFAGDLISPDNSEPIPPFEWVVPETFDPKMPGLGLPAITGTTDVILYDPKPSHADLQEGGNGVYESLQHGTYNHHPYFTLFGDYMIVAWTNHVRDENGPGQRYIARIGKFKNNDQDVDWGGDERFVELAPAPMPARRRPPTDESKEITGAFISASFVEIGGRLFLRGKIKVCDGWTDVADYHLRGNDTASPVPDAHYRTAQKRPFGLDVFWNLTGFIQEWKMENGKLSPLSELYIDGPPVPKTLQVTPSITKTLAALNAPYRQAKSFKEAPPEFRKATRGKVTQLRRPILYAPGTRHLAANGKNGVAHRTEFKRPDGKLVVVTDNLRDGSTYYAAVREKVTDHYGPAVKTNMFGCAMPVAGELPDGTVWFIGSDGARCNTFLTWSRDGKLFDRTKLLLSIRNETLPGIAKPPFGGAQYFQAVTRGNNIWVVYSIGKEKIGLTKIPFSVFR